MRLYTRHGGIENQQWRQFAEVEEDQEVEDELASPHVDDIQEGDLFKCVDGTHVVYFGVFVDGDIVQLPFISSLNIELRASNIQVVWNNGMEIFLMDINRLYGEDWEMMWRECKNPSWMLWMAKYLSMPRLFNLSIETEGLERSNKEFLVAIRKFQKYLRGEEILENVINTMPAKMMGFHVLPTMTDPMKLGNFFASGHRDKDHHVTEANRIRRSLGIGEVVYAIAKYSK